MNRSIFLEYIEKYFRSVVGKITEKFNDKATEQAMLHKTMLTEEYSADLNWGATEINHAVVAADVVALDSALPLKSRSSMSRATGKLPKLGMAMRKGERVISDINVAIARGADEATIASKIFDDTTKVIKGIEVRKEIMFLQGLSTGTCLVEDDENTGTGIRVDFGYKNDHKFTCTGSKWGESGEKPQDDIQQLFDKALEDSNTIGHVYLSKKYFNLFRHSEQGKLLAAAFQNMVITDKALLPVPSRKTFLDALEDEYGAKFHIIDSVFKIENAKGNQTAVSPWEEANIVATPSDNVGRLVYGTLAEETNPVNGVDYQKAGSHILVSKFSNPNPLEEFTTAQALCIPVIDGVDGIYLLTASEGKTLLSVDPTSLSFPKSASNRTVNVTSGGAISAESSEDWLTVTVNGNSVAASATANSGEARTATITITSGDETVTVEATQAAA